MSRRSKSDWQALFTAHASSGITATAFCHERGLNPSYFSLCRKQLLINEEEAATPSFIPVAMTSRHNIPMIELQHGHGLVVKIPISVSSAWLAELIQQLRV